ncbi:hypothetical protein LguiA_029577 [Lonicera macranthoides]
MQKYIYIFPLKLESPARNKRYNTYTHEFSFQKLHMQQLHFKPFGPSVPATFNLPITMDISTLSNNSFN